LEDYKLDNGTYPATGNSSNPAASNTNTLYKALYLDGASDSTGAKKIYLPELDPVNNKQGWTLNTSGTISIIDPWGNHYRYRTAVNTTGGPNADSQNPDFDLWSAGKDGKTKAGANDTPSQADNRDDIRNF
jgi:type II secretory pathway pseudopilin PulG